MDRDDEMMYFQDEVKDLAQKILKSGAVDTDKFSEDDALRVARFLVAKRNLTNDDRKEIKNIECFV